MNKKLLLILFLALILRLISLNQSLWLDEGIQWWAITTFPFKHLITEYIKGDFNPPLYHALMYFWVKLFGDSEIALRLPSVLFGLGTVWFAHKLGGLKAALLTATAPLLIYYSQEARMYSLSAFTATATLYFLSKKSKLYLVTAALMLYSHYLTWLLLPLLSPLVLLFLLPWLPILWAQVQNGLGAAANPIWADLSAVSIKSILLVPVKFLLGRLPVDANIFYALILLPLLCLAGYLIIKARHRLFYLWFFLPLILGAIMSLKIPVFSYFRFLFVLPAFYLLLAHGASKTKYPNLFMGIFIVVNLLATSRYLVDANLHREDWRSATAYIHNQAAPVIIYSAVRSPFEYYDRGQTLQISENTLDQVIGKPEVWYIAYAQPIFDPDNQVRTTLDQLGFQEISQRHFRGVTVIRYQNLSAKLYSYVL